MPDTFVNTYSDAASFVGAGEDQGTHIGKRIAPGSALLPIYICQQVRLWKPSAITPTTIQNGVPEVSAQYMS